MRSLLYRYGFVWSRIIYVPNSVDIASHTISLNYDHWSSDFIDDVIRLITPDPTSIIWSWEMGHIDNDSIPELQDIDNDSMLDDLIGTSLMSFDETGINWSTQINILGPEVDNDIQPELHDIDSGSDDGSLKDYTKLKVAVIN